METLTAKRVIELLREVVAEAGADHRAPVDAYGGIRCNYVHADADVPECIVGCVMFKAGVPTETMADWEGCAIDTILTDPDAAAIASILQVAQTAQDHGKSWGYALERAEAAYADLAAESE